jgi:hypothetical protein
VHAIQEPLVWVVALLGVPLKTLKTTCLVLVLLLLFLSLSGFGENQALSVCEDVFTFYLFDNLYFFKPTENIVYSLEGT